MTTEKTPLQMPQDATKRPAPYGDSPRSGGETAVIGTAAATAYLAVLPVGMVSMSPISMLLAFLMVYPYCHLFFRWRARSNNKQTQTRRNKQ